jgi:hypothetical protein
MIAGSAGIGGGPVAGNKVTIALIGTTPVTSEVVGAGAGAGAGDVLSALHPPASIAAKKAVARTCRVRSTMRRDRSMVPDVARASGLVAE